MVPSAFHWRESLPLTANGKIDRKTLTALAGELDVVEEDHAAPSTPTEQRLAAAWAKVLGIPQDQIGRRDHFFDRGGTSLSAVKLAIALDRAVSLKDLTRHPVLADLAGLVDGRSERRSGLLQPLSEPDGPPAGALVCFPYAGGNAVNFQPMAGALRGSGLAVYAVELPGHDLAAEREPFASAGPGGRAGRRRDHPAGPDPGAAVGPLLGRRVRRGDGPEAAGARGATSSGCSSARSCSATPPTGAPPSPS